MTGRRLVSDGLAGGPVFRSSILPSIFMSLCLLPFTGSRMSAMTSSFGDDRSFYYSISRLSGEKRVHCFYSRTDAPGVMVCTGAC